MTPNHSSSVFCVLKLHLLYSVTSRSLLSLARWKAPWGSGKNLLLHIEKSNSISTRLSTREKAVATHSSTLAWETPWTEEPSRGYSPWGRKESERTEWLHFHFHALEKVMATHSSILAWRIPGILWWAAIYGVARSRTRLTWLSAGWVHALQIIVNCKNFPQVGEAGCFLCINFPSFGRLQNVKTKKKKWLNLNYLEYKLSGKLIF